MYDVSLDPNEGPSCTCYDWEHNLLPCKHMFAVSSHQDIPLPEQFLNSPLFTLDLGACDYLCVCSTSDGDAQDETDGEACEKTDVDDHKDAPVMYAPLPMVHSSGAGLKARRIRCRDHLKTLSNFTYLPQCDLAQLDTLERLLASAVEQIGATETADGGLLRESISQGRPRLRRPKKRAASGT